ncbi:hypothetical protein FQA39_LY18172 [Lamprigera yunnana]|nr:hypothetical protein FQA39_LY18172 [Lamprigera yunnana]
MSGRIRSLVLHSHMKILLMLLLISTCQGLTFQEEATRAGNACAKANNSNHELYKSYIVGTYIDGNDDDLLEYFHCVFGRLDLYDENYGFNSAKIIQVFPNYVRDKYDLQEDVSNLVFKNLVLCSTLPKVTPPVLNVIHSRNCFFHNMFKNLKEAKIL